MVLRRLAFLLAPEVFAELDALRSDRAELIAVQRRREERLRSAADEARRLAEHREREIARRDEQSRKLMDQLWGRLSRNEQKVIAAIVRNGNEHLTASEIFERASFGSRQQISRVTKELAGTGILNVCLHGREGERCFTLRDEDFVRFVREKVARFDESRRNRAPVAARGSPRGEPPAPAEEPVPEPREERAGIPDDLEPAAPGGGLEPEFEEDIGYRFDFAPPYIAGGLR